MIVKELKQMILLNFKLWTDVLSKVIYPFLKFYHFLGEIIPIRLFMKGFNFTPTFNNINSKFSVKYYVNLVLVDDDERRYFK